MAYVFPSQVGVPSVVQDPRATPATFSMDLENWPGGGTNCIITGISGSTQGNYQFLLTLRNYTYVYIFGERMGEFTVQGLSLAGLCTNPFMDGMTSAITYYNNNCISTTGQPVTLVMGGYGTYAFLIGATFQYNDPENRIGQFVYKFQTITDPS